MNKKFFQDWSHVLLPRRDESFLSVNRILCEEDEEEEDFRPLRPSKGFLQAHLKTVQAHLKTFQVQMRTLKITFRHLVHWRSLGPFQLSDLLLEVKSWGSGQAWIGPLNTVYAARGFQAHLVVSRPFQRPICHKEPTSSITAQAAVILC